jgi:hypothetical protein
MNNKHRDIDWPKTLRGWWRVTAVKFVCGASGSDAFLRRKFKRTGDIDTLMSCGLHSGVSQLTDKYNFVVIAYFPPPTL